MSIIWADFPSGQQGLYGTDKDKMLNGVWAEIVGNLVSGSRFIIANDPDPNVGSAGKVLLIEGASFAGDIYTRFVYPAGAVETAGFGFRLWNDGLPSTSINGGGAMWWFANSSNVSIVHCKVLPDGSIGAYNSAGTLIGQSGPCVTANSYNHIETKVLRHASTGTLEVRVNGVAKLSLTNLALGANNISMIRVGSDDNSDSGTNDKTNYYKDLVIWDGNGSVGNDFQGSISVRDLYTDADIALNWTPSVGSTGWDLLDKTSVDDTTYISADDTPPAAYKASLTDLPPDVTSVRALLPIFRSVKTDGGDCNIQVGLTPNNVNWDDGADNPQTTAFTYRWDVSEISPATSAAWTPVEVNAAYVRVNRTL